MMAARDVRLGSVVKWGEEYIRWAYVDSLEMFFAKCKLTITKQLERYAWFGLVVRL